MVAGLSKAIGDLKRFLSESRDNFDRDVSNPLVDLIDVAGEKDFTPERLRYFKDGTRVFLEYGTDPTFSETERGYLLQPGDDQTLTMRTAEKAAYQVGFDLWPTMSRQINGPLQSGDVVAGGYGRLDLQNFDPTAVDPTPPNPRTARIAAPTRMGISGIIPPIRGRVRRSWRWCRPAPSSTAGLSTS